MAAVENGTPRISVRNLWKLFGPNPNRLMDEEDELIRTGTRSEVQEQTGHVIAVKDVSFDVGVGEVFVVMGLSGSGKSTLVRCLNRLVDPTQGSIEIDGDDVTEFDDTQMTNLRRKKTGMIFQHYGLLPHKKVLDNVAYGLEVQGVSKSDRYSKAGEVLEKVGLTAWTEAYPDQLSGGMQQRVGIARALALDPEILLMDEPFSGLDPLIRREMQDELLQLQISEQKTIVFITHDLDEALKLGDRIAIMRDGEVIQVGPGVEIVTNPSDSYVKEFVRDVSKSKVLTAGSIMNTDEPVIVGDEAIQSALESMRSNGLDHTLVVDNSRGFLGSLSISTAMDGIQNTKLDVFSIVNKECPIANPDASIQTLIDLAAKFEMPIAVVNEQNQYLGAISRQTLLRNMSETDS